VAEETATASYFTKTGDSRMLNAQFKPEKIMASKKKGTLASASAALTKAMRNMEAAMASMVGTKAKTKKKAKRKSKKSRR
jgi:hypothetical protein